MSLIALWGLFCSVCNVGACHVLCGVLQATRRQKNPLRQPATSLWTIGILKRWRLQVVPLRLLQWRALWAGLLFITISLCAVCMTAARVP